MTTFLMILGPFLLGIFFGANRLPNDLKMNGDYYRCQALGQQYGVGKLFMYLDAWTSVFFMCALLAVLLDAMTRLLISDTGEKYLSEYVFIKNDKLGYLAGSLLLVVTAVATLFGIAPQDVATYSGTWGYELSINFIALVTLIGSGAVLVLIRKREVEYGLAFDQRQWSTHDRHDLHHNCCHGLVWRYASWWKNSHDHNDRCFSCFANMGHWTQKTHCYDTRQLNKHLKKLWSEKIGSELLSYDIF